MIYIYKRNEYREYEDRCICIMDEPPIVVDLRAGYTSDVADEQSFAFRSGN